MTKPEIVIYTDNGNAPINKLVGTQCTLGIQSFLTAPSGSTLVPDYPLSAAISHGLIEQAKEGGKRKITVAIGGAGAFPSSSWAAADKNLSAFVDQICTFVTDNHFDGVDIDWEDTAAITSNQGYDPVEFLSNLSVELKKQLPSGQNFISHAPQCPYFMNDGSNPFKNTYNQIMQQAGSSIDLLNIQYYNNPQAIGTTVAEQVSAVAGTSGTPATCSIVGLVNAGIPVEKLALGKPTTPENAGSGFVDTQSLCSQLIAPLAQKYGSSFGGVMGWQFGESNVSDQLVTSWIENVAAAANSGSASAKAAE
ncbi:chitinase [Rhodobacteraceae bacterium RKSG542]|uniref:glycoside hydrolase family 18 protein n=1 Tax=Pseudovibrio flavus TaxID=2529854 RepID=UPI0012BCB697|nr:glycoside hydrolase family 18 protein [Pseudovibrio flavus]MTI19107.1 chitinase [Pseudovibrio flavus]